MYQKHEDIVILYAEREARVIELSKQDHQITVFELQSLDRLGRCMVANDAWTKCLPEAQHALLGDVHPHVRSCAEISARLHR